MSAHYLQMRAAHKGRQLLKPNPYSYGIQGAVNQLPPSRSRSFQMQMDLDMSFCLKSLKRNISFLNCQTGACRKKAQGVPGLVKVARAQRGLALRADAGAVEQRVLSHIANALI